jgi:hypothetical protein
MVACRTHHPQGMKSGKDPNPTQPLGLAVNDGMFHGSIQAGTYIDHNTDLCDTLDAARDDKPDFALAPCLRSR